MSRLPSAPGVSSGIPPPKSSRLSRQPSVDFKRKKDQAPPPLKSTKSTRTPSLSRVSVSSYEDVDSPTTPSRYSMSSIGSTQTAFTSPRSSLTSPKSMSKRASKPPPEPARLSESPIPAGLSVNDRVAVDSMNIVGTLRFLGQTHFKAGLWAGIELDIVGAGKNDGSVAGKRYFSCPPQTGLFIQANKVAPLDRDSDSVRSISPPYGRPQSAQNRASLNQITAGSRAARYIGMTASQLTQRAQTEHQKRPTMSPSMQIKRTSLSSQRSTTIRRSQSTIQSPTPTRRDSPPHLPMATAGIPSPAITPTSNSVHETDADEFDGSEDVLIMNNHEAMLTDTPEPANMAMSKSTDPTAAIDSETAHARLERVLGEAISQAPDETVMRLQQLQLRVEVLEAENKFLKLENAQNKTAQQILERSMVLKKKDGSGNEDDNDASYFTLEGHKAIVQEIKDEHEALIKTWENRTSELDATIKKLEDRVSELESEQAKLIQERDDLLKQVADARKEKTQMEHKVHELEEKVAVAEANAAAAQASRAVCTTTANFYSQDPDEMREKQMQMEMEMEEVHEKMSSLMDAMRAKDLFLGTLSEQVETHRNNVEEKEREIRRIRADADRHAREKERLREEINELEKKWLEHQECATKEQFDKLKQELTQAKESLAKESAIVEDYRKRVKDLEKSVDELKLAGMESIELYENSVELHRVDMEAINATLMDERRKVSELKVEREDLRKAGLDAIEAYEATIEELKSKHSTAVEEYERKREDMQATIDKLKQEIEQLVNASNQTEEVEKIKGVWESERKRLEEEAEAKNQTLLREREEHEQIKADLEKLREQVKESEKISKEKQKLDEQIQRLQADYTEQLNARNKYLDDVRAAVESQKKTEGELRRTIDSKEKAERDLLTAQENLVRAESSLAELRSHGPMDSEVLAKERQQHNKDMDMLRSEIEKLEAQNLMLTKQKESAELAAKANESDKGAREQWKKEVELLQAENKRLAEAHKQAETECLKLMDEVEKLHAESSLQPQIISLNDCKTEDEKVQRLQEQLTESKRQMERLLVRHSAEVRQLNEKQAEEDSSRQREITTLRRDISELETLIESKIFKEADLEEALEKERKQVGRLEDELSDLKDQIRQLSRQQNETERLITKNTATTATSAAVPDKGPYCELCEVPGHDTLSCKVALDTSTVKEGDKPVSYSSF
ncbi:hypothetical protein EC973_002146 [Apophysomyces ossiformis]|uniref:CAP-Gly domain-containing protein n=1 Tax=Apophysomyces ossiformis TaxID=679940 RepID=A0A8H7BSR8_9FUNG|nr:hypothetical protein EC973_002146 [Apophysomyces ossiformis]